VSTDKETRDTKPTDASRRSGAALEATMQFILRLIPTLDKPPRSQMFLLGNRTENQLVRRFLHTGWTTAVGGRLPA